ncbi:hypothetical protein [Salinimicrobium terrae]|uniref:hypothetical protein n=1 Tax=Salinimicrobium terrae TaxID=470866 RepID=UPI0004291427|nr:hypothetical protein [Salinimicrobium terrae]
MKLWQKISLVLFTGLILFPSAVDLAHVFAGHQHYSCNHYAESHFHQKTVDCDIFHLQQNPFSFPPLDSWSLHEPEVENTSIGKEYNFLSAYQKLHFSLRAPPARG